MIDRRIDRDAVEIPPKHLPAHPVSIETYDLFVDIKLSLGGQSWAGLGYERRNYADGRTAFRADIRPVLSGGGRGRWCPDIWVWGDPRAMITRSFGTSPVEETARPGDAQRVRNGPPQGDSYVLPRIENFGPDRRPVPVRILVGGQWHPAKAFRRWTDTDGVVSVHVKICFVEDGWPMDHWRFYHWDPAAIVEGHDTA
ncbi:hypothetical protein HRW23_34760 [Streptomyces lunaelactis]|uniref:hypothetical protein n=1 Tax=Streptomyces lunaelactis TaxID=1535768 RepID=UPI001584B0C9|nr:hypothetical protein [Streptomyces lunaelactis]NUK07861.1 hypothetical protein [Streptomyces lunaelactis]NUK37489.1 hypothetical protein [Streptomyces lunaelactis]NUK40980.1 hypothetical protein [Streptomyces lunaelactis]NUK71044.1 hypothetical protein [Streptomyces lunaelactis]NUK82431.1 hypothetical protein [Streptomyces lunaelactis]